MAASVDTPCVGGGAARARPTAIPWPDDSTGDSHNAHSSLEETRSAELDGVAVVIVKICGSVQAEAAWWTS